AKGIVLGLGGGDGAAAHHLLRECMVARDLMKGAVARDVAATIADVRNVERGVRGVAHRQRRSHALQLGATCRLDEDSLICRPQRVLKLGQYAVALKAEEPLQ